ncbi:MAG: hypothetical protein ACRBCS_15240 [Cellvibrionaceae bacterium]
MSILSNKHVVAALIIAPLLAIGSYFAVDALVSEAPKNAQAGNNYQLVEKPNCRYSSGQCELKNGNFELTLTGTQKDNQKDNQKTIVTVNSIHPLDGIKIAYGHENSSLTPSNMTMINSNQMEWTIELPPKTEDNKRLFIVASAKDSLYFGDASIAFIDYKTSFSKDFR